MGLINTAVQTLEGVLNDQWKEYFYCDSIERDILVVRGQKRTKNSNKGNDNVISNGSTICVADGQCMIIVDQGKVVEICAEPGEFIYDASTEPSIFSGNLGESLINTFKVLGKRFTYAGDTAREQRVYYFNTKEIMGNKYGTATPVPFRVVDERAGIDMDVSMKCFGEYSYRLCDPILFYTNVCSNVKEDFRRSEIDSQLKTELLTSLQPAFAQISAMGVRYSAIMAHTQELADALNDVLSKKWRETRGIEIVQFGISSITADEEDEKTIKELQKNAAFMDPTRAAARLVNAQAEAMQTAAANPNGAMMGFMGMGMAQNAGGMNAQTLFQMGAQQQAAQPQQAPVQPAAPAGAAQPSAAGSWICSCGATVTGKFCTECGNPKPADDGWTCKCGAVNKGKFCSECGSPKPAGAPLYKCDKCGWEPEDPHNPPKFCPECGDPFGDEDIVG